MSEPKFKLELKKKTSNPSPLIKNYDSLILSKWTDWDEKKKTTFRRFYDKKHLSGLPQIVDLSNFDTAYATGILDLLYEVNMSITQSFRSGGGKDFEKYIYETLDELNLSYSSQITIDHQGLVLGRCIKGGQHTIDLVIPKIQIGENISDPKFKIVSIKTKLRERYLQDKFIAKFNQKIYLITLDQKSINDTDFIPVRLIASETNFTNFLRTLIE